MQLISPKNIYFGKDSTKNIYKILSTLKVKKSYILCDPILKELGLINNVTEILESYNIRYKVSSNVIPEPTVEKGNEIIEEVREEAPDLIIGLGGGSTIDLAKAASVGALQEGTIENYMNLTGDKDIENKKLPSILMPSTSGTGAEVTDISVFSLEDSKDAITNPLMIADYAIIDPVYTYSLPPKIAAASGVDALTHAIESYTSIHASPVTDMLAYEAIEKIYTNIREAVWDKNNFSAKDHLSIGSFLAGISFYNAGVAGVHALAYPLGGNFKIPHGESNAVLLPYVYNRIYKSCSIKLATLAPLFNIIVEGKSSMTISREIVQRLFTLIEDVGLPKTLAHYSITEEDIESLTLNALKQRRLLERSPLELTESDIRGIYMDALKNIDI